MSTSDQRDQEIIAHFKEQERIRRLEAEEARKAPKGPKQPATTNQLIVRSAVAICLVVAGSAYYLSPSAFWKPQDVYEAYCARNDGTFWFLHRGKCFMEYLKAH